MIMTVAAEAAVDGHADVNPHADEHQQSGASPQDEWTLIDLPQDALPLPLIRVRNLLDEATPEDLKSAIEALGVTVLDITLDPEQSQELGSLVALVRLPPLPLPWTEDSKLQLAAAQTQLAELQQAASQEQDQADPATDSATLYVRQQLAAMQEARFQGDVFQYASRVCSFLKASCLQVHDQILVVDAPTLDVVVWIGNLPPDQDMTVLRSELSVSGEVLRLWLAMGSAQRSKGYAFAEFATPAAAKRSREYIDRRWQECQSAYKTLKRAADEAGRRQRVWGQSLVRQASVGGPQGGQGVAAKESGAAVEPSVVKEVKSEPCAPEAGSGEGGEVMVEGKAEGKAAEGGSNGPVGAEGGEQGTQAGVTKAVGMQDTQEAGGGVEAGAEGKGSAGGGVEAGAEEKGAGGGGVEGGADEKGPTDSGVEAGAEEKGAGGGGVEGGADEKGAAGGGLISAMKRLQEAKGAGKGSQGAEGNVAQPAEAGAAGGLIKRLKAGHGRGWRKAWLAEAGRGMGALQGQSAEWCGLEGGDEEDDGLELGVGGQGGQGVAGNTGASAGGEAQVADATQAASEQLTQQLKEALTAVKWSMRCEVACVKDVPCSFARNVCIQHIKRDFQGEERLVELLKHLGTVTHAAVARYPNGIICGHAYIEFEHSSQAEAALRLLLSDPPEEMGLVHAYLCNPAKTDPCRPAAPVSIAAMKAAQMRRQMQYQAELKEAARAAGLDLQARPAQPPPPALAAPVAPAPGSISALKARQPQPTPTPAAGPPSGSLIAAKKQAMQQQHHHQEQQQWTPGWDTGHGYEGYSYDAYAAVYGDSLAQQVTGLSGKKADQSQAHAHATSTQGYSAPAHAPQQYYAMPAPEPTVQTYAQQYTAHVPAAPPPVAPSAPPAGPPGYGPPPMAAAPAPPYPPAYAPPFNHMQPQQPQPGYPNMYNPAPHEQHASSYYPPPQPTAYPAHAAPQHAPPPAQPPPQPPQQSLYQPQPTQPPYPAPQYQAPPTGPHQPYYIQPVPPPTVPPVPPPAGNPADPYWQQAGWNAQHAQHAQPYVDAPGWSAGPAGPWGGPPALQGHPLPGQSPGAASLISSLKRRHEGPSQPDGSKVARHS